MSGSTARTAVDVVPLTALPALPELVRSGWLTATEAAWCGGFRRASEHAGARLAAKRAVAALLGWPGDLPWSDVEVVREANAPPRVLLRGSVEEWRSARGLAVPRVSLTHVPAYAGALAWLP